MSDPRAIAAVIAAAGTALAVVALALGAALEIARPEGHLSEQAATVLSTVLGALVGALAGYLGGGREP